MKKIIFTASQARDMYETGGYLSLRADNEVVAAVINYKPSRPSWVTLITPKSKIWGMAPLTSDILLASGQAVLRDTQLQSEICNLFPTAAICGLAPPAFAEACVPSGLDHSIHGSLLGYFCFRSVNTDFVHGVDYAIQKIENWITTFPEESVVHMSDAQLEKDGWLSHRLSSEQYFGQLLFATPPLGHGSVGKSKYGQIINALENCLAADVSIRNMQLDPRFFKSPKFSLGLMSLTVVPASMKSEVLRVAFLRAQLVERLPSPLLFDGVSAERNRLDDEYAHLFKANENLYAELMALLDKYIFRWKEMLTTASIG